MHRVLLLIATSLSAACAPLYGGQNCHSITTQTPLSALPELGPLSPAPAGSYRHAEPFITGTTEIACCTNAYFTSPTCAGEVDCDAYWAKLRVGGLSGKYVGEPCSPARGGATTFCSVYVDETDRIVGVRTFCAD